MRRVPLVVVGATDPVASAFRALVESLRGDLAGREGFHLDLAEALGPEPSIVVDAITNPDPDTVVARRRAGMMAIGEGHALVTADLATFTDDPVDLAVAVADRRVGLSAALLPGSALVTTLARLRDAGDRVEEIVLTGAGPAQLAREATVVSGLMGIELAVAQVRVGRPGTAGDDGAWSATISGDAFPRVDPVPTPAPAGASSSPTSRPAARSASIRTARLASPLTLHGPSSTVEVVAAELFADVVELARQVDPPWRAHRRKVASFR